MNGEAEGYLQAVQRELVPRRHRAPLEDLMEGVVLVGGQETGERLGQARGGEGGQTGPRLGPEAHQVVEGEDIRAVVGMGVAEDQSRQPTGRPRLLQGSHRPRPRVEHDHRIPRFDKVARTGTAGSGVGSVGSQDAQSHAQRV